MLARALPPFSPHLDVLALVVVLEGGYLWALRRLGPKSVRPGAQQSSGHQVAWFTAGVVVIWIAAAWPVDDLGEHFLFSVHMFQHMLLGLVAPPMLLRGSPAWLLRKLLRPAWLKATFRQLCRPFVALIIFNAMIVLIHWPAVEDLALRNESFHFFTHYVIFGAGILFWWPVISPLPEMPGLSYPGRMVYLFLASIVPTVPASFLTFGSTPLYPFYTHVPRIWGMSVLTDQRISGLLLKLGGGALLWTVLAVTFFKWYSLENNSEGWDALEWRDVERDVRSGLSRNDEVRGPAR